MTRFAVLGPESDAPPNPGVLADLARRIGAAPVCRQAGHWTMMQAGPIHSLGPLTLCGDLGLTDLSDLRALAGILPEQAPALALMALWLRHGADMLRHLHGTFAFALHDARTQDLWLVRDRFGVRPLVHAQTGRGMVAASDIGTVLAGLGRTPEPDQAWVADFLTGHETCVEATAHAGIRRLAPGHLMRVDAGGSAARRAWYRLTDAPDPAPQDGAEALREALRHATQQACSLQPCAAMLSGGLDSSSLALLSVQPGQMRPALSLRFDDPRLDEGAEIEAVLAQADGGLQPVHLDGQADDGLFDFPALLEEQGQPAFAPGLAGGRRLYAQARSMGMTGILDGHGGDEVINGGLWNIARLAGEGRWPLALRLSVLHARFAGDSPVQSVARLLTWKGRRGAGRLGRMLLRDPASDPMEWRALVDPDLAARTDLVARVRAAGRSPVAAPDAMHAHAGLLDQPMTSTAFEVLDRAARRAGMTPHYPFYDHRVVELCVWQPDEAKIAGGQPRSLLREAMRGVLPERIRMRRDKVNFIGNFWWGLRRDPRARIARLAQDLGPLHGWVDPATLRRDADRLRDQPEPDADTAFRLWRALCLAAWLDRVSAAAPRLSKVS